MNFEEPTFVQKSAPVIDFKQQVQVLLALPEALPGSFNPDVLALAPSLRPVYERHPQYPLRRILPAPAVAPSPAETLAPASSLAPPETPAPAPFLDAAPSLDCATAFNAVAPVGPLPQTNKNPYNPTIAEEKSLFGEIFHINHKMESTEEKPVNDKSVMSKVPKEETRKMDTCPHCRITFTIGIFFSDKFSRPKKFLSSGKV